MTRPRAAVLALALLACTETVAAAPGTTNPTPKAAAEGSCHLPDAALQNQITVAKDAAGAGGIDDKIFTTPTPLSEMACLSSIIKGGNAYIHLPSLGSIINGIVKRACNAMQNAWNQTAGQITHDISLPYGLGEISPARGYEAVPGVTGPINDGVKKAQEGADAADQQVQKTVNQINHPVTKAGSDSGINIFN